MMICPYGARSFNQHINSYFNGIENVYEETIYRDIQEGVVMKCNFCIDRVEKGLRRGLKPGSDEEATPICVVSCISKARYFGDLDDPESEVSKLLTERKFFRIHKELGTEPSVYYLTP